MILQRVYAAGNNKTPLARHVNYSKFLPDFNEIWNFSTGCHKSPQDQVPRNVSSDSRADTCRQTNSRTDTTKFIGALRDCANAPKK